MGDPERAGEEAPLKDVSSRAGGKPGPAPEGAPKPHGHNHEPGFFELGGQRSCSSDQLRTQLANERTFLAWVRTGLALVAFGFVVEKASPFLQQFAPDVAAQQSTFIHTSGIAGIVLMLAGSVVIILATLRFWHTTTLIEHSRYRTSTKLDAAIALTIAIVSLVLIVFLVFQSTAFTG